MRFAHLSACFALGVIALVGCEPTSGAKAPVNALLTVTGPDGSPLTDVVLNLQPTTVAGSPMAFKLTDGTVKADQALPGTYIVFITALETGPNVAKSNAVLKTIPIAYQSAKETNTVEVKEGAVTVSIK